MTRGREMDSDVRSPLEAVHQMGDPYVREKYRKHLLEHDPSLNIGEIREDDQGLFQWLRKGGDYE